MQSRGKVWYAPHLKGGLGAVLTGCPPLPPDPGRAPCRGPGLHCTYCNTTQVLPECSEYGGNGGEFGAFAAELVARRRQAQVRETMLYLVLEARQVDFTMMQETVRRCDARVVVLRSLVGQRGLVMDHPGVLPRCAPNRCDRACLVNRISVRTSVRSSVRQGCGPGTRSSEYSTWNIPRRGLPLPERRHDALHGLIMGPPPRAGQRDLAVTARHWPCSVRCC